MKLFSSIISSKCLGGFLLARQLIIVSSNSFLSNDDESVTPLSLSSLPQSNYYLRQLGNVARAPATTTASSNRLTARSDCTFQVVLYLQDPTMATLAEEEEFLCELNAADIPGGYTGQMRKLSLTDKQKSSFKNMWKDGRLTPGTSKIKVSDMANGVQFDSEKIQVSPEIDVMSLIEIDNPPDKKKHDLFNRDLQSFGTHIGDKPMLVVKVIDKDGLAPGETTSVISDDVFGTFGDTVTLKSQLNACSMNRLTVITGDNNSGQINQSVYSAPGVITVTIGISLQTNDSGTIRNAITTAVQQKLGVTLPGPYKHVIYVLEKCYVYGTEKCGWVAYAFVNHWLSVHKSVQYKYVGALVHELGHNFGLLHSGGLDGKEYTDHTCAMGNPLFHDDIGRMCFNAAKSWQIGWYNDRKIALNPKTASASNPNWSYTVTLVGIADYKTVDVANVPVVLKLETGTVNDYFIAFNRAVGVNADNVQADDEVTVVYAGNNGDSASLSSLKATLAVGEEYAIANFGGGARACVIKFGSLVKPSTDSLGWKAVIQVTTSGTSPPTLQPTRKPTFKPTTLLQPTAKPTTSKPTTLQPNTVKPTTSKPTTLQPNTVKPSTLQPTLKPIILQPTSSQPTSTGNPTTSQPTAKPTTLIPTSNKPSSLGNPTSSTPTTEKPTPTA